MQYKPKPNKQYNQLRNKSGNQPTAQPTAQTNQLLVDRMARFVDMLALFTVMLLVLATATTVTIVLITMMNDMSAVTLAYCSRVILVVLADLAR